MSTKIQAILHLTGANFNDLGCELAYNLGRYVYVSTSGIALSTGESLGFGIGQPLSPTFVFSTIEQCSDDAKKIADAVRNDRFPNAVIAGTNPFKKTNSKVTGEIKAIWDLSSREYNDITGFDGCISKVVYAGRGGFSVTDGCYGNEYGLGGGITFRHSFGQKGSDQYREMLRLAIERDRMPKEYVGENPFRLFDRSAPPRSKAEAYWSFTPKEYCDAFGVAVDSIYVSHIYVSRDGIILANHKLERGVGYPQSWPITFTGRSTNQRTNKVLRAIEEGRMPPPNEGVDPFAKINTASRERKVQNRSNGKTRPSLRLGDLVKRKKPNDDGKMYRVLGAQLNSMECRKLRVRQTFSMIHITAQGFAEVQVRGLDGVTHVFRRRDLWKVPNQPRTKVPGKNIARTTPAARTTVEKKIKYTNDYKYPNNYRYTDYYGR